MQLHARLVAFWRPSFHLHANPLHHRFCAGCNSCDLLQRLRLSGQGEREGETSHSAPPTCFCGYCRVGELGEPVCPDRQRAVADSAHWPRAEELHRRGRVWGVGHQRCTEATFYNCRHPSRNAPKRRPCIRGQLGCLAGSVRISTRCAARKSSVTGRAGISSSCSAFSNALSRPIN